MTDMSILAKMKRLVIGAPLNPFNPGILRHVSLIALLAWVGLGADGLSSSCYGPEQAFTALSPDTRHLALFIAMAMAITVFIISFAYNQVIELFPNGGGGYKVASELLGSYVGLISGAALLIDYVLTIAVSTASGMDAAFSLLPANALPYKLLCENTVILFLMVLNMRGMKESIKFLMPIFLGFFVTHVALIVYGIAAHSRGLLTIIPETLTKTHELSLVMGWLPLLAYILHAYSLGSGTYTGLEAVSNNVNRLAQPRVRTGKWTMFYMAISLSFTASGIILLYLLWQAVPTEGLTLNAVVFHSILGDSQFGGIALITTLALEAGLLFMAANSGFLAGPSVLANMAVDSWVPNRFRHLSSRLVVQNGVIVFGLLALMLLSWSGGRVSLLVILYSINVFITFSLSLLGLTVFWAKNRFSASRYWIWRCVFSFFAFLLTSSILCITLYSKFLSGGWVTIAITCAVILICLIIKKHYNNIAQKLKQLDSELSQPIFNKTYQPVLINHELPTAVILVGKSAGVGMHTLLSIIRLFPMHFKNFIFISIGIVDVDSFTERSKLEKMRYSVSKNLQYFVDYCHQYGIPSEARVGYGTDIVKEVTILADEISKEYPHSIFFSSKLVFEDDNWIMRLLHNETAIAIQRNLHLQGKELVILPMKLKI